MSRVGGKIRVGRVTPIQQFFFFGLMVSWADAQRLGSETNLISLFYNL